MAQANLKQIIFEWLAHALQILASRFAGASSGRNPVNEDPAAVEEDVRAQWLQRYRPGQPPEDWLQRFGGFEKESIVARAQNRAVLSGYRAPVKLEQASSLNTGEDREDHVSEIGPSYLPPSRQKPSGLGPATDAKAGSSTRSAPGHAHIRDTFRDSGPLPRDKAVAHVGGDRVPTKREISALAADELAKALEVKRRARAVVPPKRVVRESLPNESLPDEPLPGELMSNELLRNESLTNESRTRNSIETRSLFSKSRGLEGNSLEGNFDDQVRRASASSAGEQTNVEPYETEPPLDHHMDGTFPLPNGNVDSISSVPHGGQPEWHRWEDQRMRPLLEEQRLEEQRFKGQTFGDQRFASQASENAPIPPYARRLHPRQADAIRDGAWKSGSPLWSLPDTFEQREESLFPSLDQSGTLPGLRRRSHAGVSNLESSPFVHNNRKDEEQFALQSPSGANDGSHWAVRSREAAADQWPKLPEVWEEDRQEPGEVLKAYKRQLRLAHEQRGIV